MSAHDTPPPSPLSPVPPDISHADARALRERLSCAKTFTFVPCASGLYPASPQRSEGARYRHVWLRDNALLIEALRACGHTVAAKRAGEALVRYSDRYAARFDPSAVHEALADPMHRPHVRLDGDTLDELPEVWPHAQNDAHGYLLMALARLCRDGLLDPQVFARVAARIVAFLAALPCTTDRDSGHWEEDRAVRASSIGTVCAGCTEAAEVAKMHGHADLARAARVLADLARAALAAILPYETHDPTAPRAFDAALLFLIEPLGIVDEANTETLIERTLGALEGERGIRRYRGDTFWGPDYHLLDPSLRTANASKDASFRLSFSEEGKEAQWCLFDPVLSTHFGKRYERTDDPTLRERQVYHLNRSLAALVPTEAGELFLPELYYHREGVLTPNTIVPLYWAQANLMCAIDQLVRTSRP